ncbi:MAG: MFS transporter [Actinomycetota bacterium]|nr:MFS transporter [Actinomycetota bacterium]
MPFLHHAAALLPSGPVTEMSSARRRLGMTALLIAAAFMAADITITNVALPTIAAELAAPMSSLQWVVDSYNITVAGLLLLGAGLGERYSRKGTFLAGISLFLAGSVMAGLSTSVGSLVAARTVTGVGGAIALAPAISLITMMYVPDQRAKAVAAWSAAGALGLAVSPIAAGAILTVASWNWAFLINVPAMIAIIVLGVLALPPGRNPKANRLDIIGAILSVLGLGLVLGAVIEAPARGWTDPVILVAGTVGIVACTAFVLWELRRPEPMFEVRVLVRRGVLGASLALFASFLAFAGVIFLIAQDLQVVNGVSPMQLGMCLVPFAAGVWLGSHEAARIARAIGAAATLSWGMGLVVLAFVALAVSAPWQSIGAIVAASFVCALGCGLLFPIGSVVILNDLPAELTGTASGTSMLARMAGASVGVAVLGSVVAASLGSGSAHADPVAFAHGMQWAYGVGALLLIIIGVGQAAALSRWQEPTL